MFGKGVYLADISSKSAGYTAYHSSGGVGLLLLCEAELGKPMLELTNSDYNAGEEAKRQGKHSTWGKGMTAPVGWKDAGCVNKSLKGVIMVCFPQSSILIPTNFPFLFNSLIRLTHPVTLLAAHTCSTTSSSATTLRRSGYGICSG